MKQMFPFLVLALLAGGCAGNRTASNRTSLPPVASGPYSTPSKAVTINGRDRGTFVALKPQGVVTVDLDSNTNAGYQWKLAQPLDSNVLTLVSSGTNQLPPIAIAPDNITRPEPQQWVFKAVGPGTTKVRMIYSRPDRPLNEAVSYDFTVNAE